MILPNKPVSNTIVLSVDQGCIPEKEVRDVWHSLKSRAIFTIR